MPANRPAKRRNKRGESHANFALPKARHVAIIAVPPARMLDVVGPAEVFTDANKLHGVEPVYEVEIIAAAEDRAVPSQIGVPILAHRTYRELQGPVDTLLVAGGEWPPDKRHSPDFLSWLREAERSDVWVQSALVLLSWLMQICSTDGQRLPIGTGAMSLFKSILW